MEEPAPLQLPEEDIKRLTWTQESGRKKTKEELKEKRERDRVPFRRATPEEELQENKSRKEHEERSERGSSNEPDNERKERRRWGEDTPFRMATAEEWGERPRRIRTKGRAAGPAETGKEARERTAGPTEKEDVGMCSPTQMRRGLRKGKIQLLGAIKIEEEEEGKQAKEKERAKQEIMLSGLPEEYPILKRPSEWLREENKEVDKDVGELLDEFRELFRELPRGGAKGRELQHHIHTVPGEVPEYKRSTYPLPEDKLAKLKEYLKELIDKEFIVPSQSPVAAPVFFVKKPDGSLRLVVDYRPLNKITIKDDYPIPKIQDLINRLGKAKWFTKIDLQKGYYQVEIAEEDRWKSAFKTRYGTFQFLVMPFGLSGAPATFQRLMQNIFINELDEFVVIYLDDVLVYSRTREEHMQHLRRVLEKAREHKLFLQLPKCEIVKQRVNYLGFVIEPGKVSADPKKVKTIQEWPEELLTKREVRGFLGLVGYYRKLIPNFTKMALPLFQLLKDDSDGVWRGRHTRAVQELKAALITTTNLQIYDPDKPVVIKTDASKHAIGAVLEQEGRPIAFESRKSNEREQQLPAYESELRAIVHALTKWRQFLGAKKVIIETDHATLSRILKQREVNPRLAYWLDKILDFNIEVVYKPGRQNVVADAISRRPDFVAIITRGKEKEKQKGDIIKGEWDKEYEECKDFQRVRRMQGLSGGMEARKGDSGRRQQQRSKGESNSVPA